MRVELLLGKNIEDRIRTVASAGKLSRTKGTVFDVLDSCEVYEKNLGIVKRIIGMGHKSIEEHDYFVFALSDVSPIIEQTIIGYRLTSFTIKSGRNVDFRNVGYYVPSFKDQNNELVNNQEEVVNKYREHMDYLFGEYGKLVDAGVKEEDARFVLPYSFHTNIIMGLDARELERMINEFLYGKLSKIDEIRELGEHLLDVVNNYVPYMEQHISKDNKSTIDWYDKYRIGGKIKSYDKPRMVRHTPKVDDTIILSTIMYHEQVTLDKAKRILKQMELENPNIKKEIMDDIIACDEQREFEQVNFQFEIPISLIVLKHLTRHRMQSLLVPTFAPMWDLSNYQTPPSIAKLDLEHYQEVQANNLELFNEFKKLGIRDEDLIYFYLCGTMANVTTTMNGRTLEWISRMRCCTKAQWEIRNIANELVKQVKEIAPLYGNSLGATCDVYGYCPEGKESCGKIEAIQKVKR
jgi:thymidylate synthase (FAD)